MGESVIRLERRQGYTVLQNEMLRDKRLSLKTKGLFAVMLSLPGSWQYSVSGLAAVTGAGRDAIRTSLKKLRETGYLTMERQSHGEHGKFAGSIYILREESISPCAENPATAEEAAPQPDFPSTDEPSTENPTQVNKDLLEERPSNPPLAPQKGARPKKYELTEDARALLNAYVGRDRALADALAAFIEVREVKEAVNSGRAIRMLLTELDRLSKGDRETKLLLIRQSVNNSWKGIFPLRGGAPPAVSGRIQEREEVPTW